MRKAHLLAGATLCLCAAWLASSADAATLSSPGVSLLAGRPQVRVWSAASPAASDITTTLPASEQLSTNGRPIRIGRSTYWLDVDAYNVDSSSQLNVFLLRGTPAHYQLHDYWWLRQPSLTVNRRRMTAHLAGGGISPSAIQLNFSPTRVWSHTCLLSGGGTGTFRKAVGTITARAFRVVTNTSPVFGTIRVRPRRAVLTLDPGCRPAPTHINVHPCPSAELISAPTQSPSEWGIDVTPDGTHTQIESFAASQAPTKLQHTHLSVETLPRSDLPPPTLTATGATATMLTGGSLFAAGVGLFTSTDPPSIFTGSCIRAGVHHTFRTTEYWGGTLASGVPRLIALFDTGHIGLTAPAGAYLDVTPLTS